MDRTFSHWILLAFACSTSYATCQDTNPPIYSEIVRLCLDLTQQTTARFIVRDNVLHDNRGHGVLVDAIYRPINHNTIYHNSLGAVATDSGFGAESAGATNLDISDNPVSNPGTVAAYNSAISVVAGTEEGSIVASPVFDKTLEGATTGPTGIDPTDDRISVESNCTLYGDW